MPRALIVLALTVLAAGCDYCIWHPNDPMCPPPPSPASRICDHLIDCGRFAENDRAACISNHGLRADPSRCLECVERTSCEEVADACADDC